MTGVEAYAAYLMGLEFIDDSLLFESRINNKQRTPFLPTNQKSLNI